MRDILSRHFRLILILVVPSILLAALAFRFFVLVREGRQNPELDQRPAGESSRPAVDIQNTETRAVPESSAKLPMVTYRDRRFAPETITLEQNVSKTGCVVRIENQSDAPLTIRLSPHEKALKGNYGGQYDPIPPGKSIIIDPRFDMGYASFHNHAKPSEEFHVAIGNSCRSDL